MKVRLMGFILKERNQRHCSLMRDLMLFNSEIVAFHPVGSITIFKSFGLCALDLFAYKLHYKINITLILKKSTLMLLGLCAVVKAS